MIKTEYKPVKLYSFEESWTVFRKRTFWGFVWYQEIWEWADEYAKRLPILTTRSRVNIIIHILERRYRNSFRWRTLGYRARRFNPWKLDNK